jgi:hypothetical protein
MNSDIFQDLHIDTVEETETEEKKPVEVELLSQTQTATYLSSNYTISFKVVADSVRRTTSKSTLILVHRRHVTCVSRKKYCPCRLKEMISGWYKISPTLITVLLINEK